MFLASCVCTKLGIACVCSIVCLLTPDRGIHAGYGMICLLCPKNISYIPCAPCTKQGEHGENNKHFGIVRLPVSYFSYWTSIILYLFSITASSKNNNPDIQNHRPVKNKKFETQAHKNSKTGRTQKRPSRFNLAIFFGGLVFICHDQSMFGNFIAFHRFLFCLFGVIKQHV